MPLSPYVAKLRQAFGHEPIQLPGVSALISDGHDRVLLGREPLTEQWCVIGGAVELGESPSEAMLREAREECRVEIELSGIAAVVGGPRYQVVYDNGDVVEYVAIVYDAVIVEGSIEPDGSEIAELRWFTKQEALGLDLIPFARNLFEDLNWNLVA